LRAAVLARILLHMFHPFRAFLGAIARLTESIQRLIIPVLELQRAMAEQGPSEKRLADLEQRQAMWEVEMEALVAAAKGKYDAANNAEVRTRTMKRHYEKEADPLTEPSEQVDASVPGGDVEGSEEDGVPPLRMAMAPANSKTKALRHKWTTMR